MITRIFFCLILAFSLSTNGFSQNEKTKDWYQQHPQSTSYRGIGLDAAYAMVQDKSPQPIVVAIIDSGVDVDHEDLKENIWVNADEIPDNGIDDDNNGYIDDLNGWSFIGGKEGDVDYDLLEFTRVFKGLYTKYNGKDAASIANEEKADFARYLKMKEEHKSRVEKSKTELQELKQTQEVIAICKEIIASDLGKKYTLEDLKNINYTDERMIAAKEVMLQVKELDMEDAIFEAIKDTRVTIDKMYSLTWDPRSIVGDNYEDVNERYYGNNHVWGPHAQHGTHVAGIVGATRNNGIGMDGIASSAQLMVLRAVPNGDERDKDVANAIRYAVDNGAKVVNMSFGKSYSPQKPAVDAAVKYAESKGVLLIHAAGNSNKNVDVSNNFPNDKEGNKGEIANNWIEVGASSYVGDKDLAAPFSNYGKRSVDLFAPGHDIYSTTPGDEYAYLSGTSMASPVTAGVAALVWSYFPELTAVQLKEVLLKSATPFKKQKVTKPGGSSSIKFKKLSASAGIVNAEEAMRLAREMVR